MERLRAEEALASSRRAKEERLAREREYARETLVPEIEALVAKTAAKETRDCIWVLPIQEEDSPTAYNPAVAKQVVERFLTTAGYRYQIKAAKYTKSDGDYPTVAFHICWDTTWTRWAKDLLGWY